MQRFNEVGSTRLSRRNLLKYSLLTGISVSVAAPLLAACDDTDDSEPDVDAAQTDDDSDADDDADTTEDSDDADDDVSEDTDDAADERDGEGVYGGTLNVAIIGEIGTFDCHLNGSSVGTEVLFHTYEHLFTYDEDIAVQPELAESLEISDDGLTNTMTIRQGVSFHNGEPMTASDVIASLERWGEISSRAGIFLDVLEMEEIDDHTIEFNLTEPLGAFQNMLGRQNAGAAIYPKSVMDEVGTSQIEDPEYFIGTGAYKFVEYLPDRHTHVERFEDYTSHPAETSGYYGYKHQYLDEIYFIPVPDESSRIAGLQAGDYDFVRNMHADNYDRLNDDPNVRAERLDPQSWGVITLNMREGLMTNHTLRRAVQACLDMEPVCIAGFGEGWFELSPEIMVGVPFWYTEAGAEYYNQGNPDLAVELMEEAGYDGELIRWATTQERQEHYSQVAAAAQQLSDIGFDIEIQIYDWATLSDVRNDPSAYEMAFTGHTFRAEPLTLTPIPGTDHDAWWDTPEKNEAVARLTTETDPDERLSIWEEVQTLWYEQVPRIKTGNRIEIQAMSSRLKGRTDVSHIQALHVNVWLEDE